MSGKTKRLIAAAGGCIALTITTAFAGPVASADETIPYDLQATGVMTRHADDPSLLDIDVTVLNKGPGSVSNVLMGPRADFGTDTFELVSVAQAGETDKSWACAYNPAQPYLLTQCFYPNLEPNEVADHVKLTFRVDPNANLVKGSIGTLGAEDLPKPSNERREAEPYSNYAFFAFGSQVTSAPSLSGQVWYDGNGNGMKEKPEKFAEGVKVTITRDGVPVWQTTTDAEGRYEALTIWEGNYQLRVDAGEGYASTEVRDHPNKLVSNLDATGAFNFFVPDVVPRNPVNIPPANLTFTSFVANAGLR